MKSSNQSTIAITGANGFLGSALVEHFASKNWRVKALVRKPPNVSKKNVSYISYDLTKPLDPKLLSGVDYLVHTAYMKQDRRNPKAFDINISAAKNLAKAARMSKIKKCLFMSSMSAHEEAISAYGRQKLAIEKILNGPNFVSIRAGLIIGNGGIVQQMIKFMRSKHIVPLVGGGKQPLQIVAIEDLVQAIEKLLKSKLSGVFTVATPQIYSYKQLYQTISRQLHIKVVYVPVPFFVLLNGLRLINLLPIPISVNPDNALGLKQLRSVNTKSELKKIGVNLRTLEESLEKIKL